MKLTFNAYINQYDWEQHAACQERPCSSQKPLLPVLFQDVARREDAPRDQVTASPGDAMTQQSIMKQSQS
jgi:hypothetical protein